MRALNNELLAKNLEIEELTRKLASSSPSYSSSSSPPPPPPSSSPSIIVPSITMPAQFHAQDSSVSESNSCSLASPSHSTSLNGTQPRRSSNYTNTNNPSRSMLNTSHSAHRTITNTNLSNGIEMNKNNNTKLSVSDPPKNERALTTTTTTSSSSSSNPLNEFLAESSRTITRRTSGKNNDTFQKSSESRFSLCSNFSLFC